MTAITAYGTMLNAATTDPTLLQAAIRDLVLPDPDARRA